MCTQEVLKSMLQLLLIDEILCTIGKFERLKEVENQRTFLSDSRSYVENG